MKEASRLGVLAVHRASLDRRPRRQLGMRRHFSVLRVCTGSQPSSSRARSPRAARASSRGTHDHDRNDHTLIATRRNLETRLDAVRVRRQWRARRCLWRVSRRIYFAGIGRPHDGDHHRRQRRAPGRHRSGFLVPDHAGLFRRVTGSRANPDPFVTVDAAWHPSWVGTEQVRFIRIDGDRMEITTAPQTLPLYGKRVGRGVLRWVRA